MKNIIKLFLIILLSFSFLNSYASQTPIPELKVNTQNSGKDNNNDYLEDIGQSEEFFGVYDGGEKGMKNLILNIARDLKTVIFTIILIVIMVMAFKLIAGGNTDEERKKFQIGIIWASVGIVVMQTAYSFYKILFDQGVGKTLGERLTGEIVQPFIELLLNIAPMAFIAVGIYAFYKIITANGDEEKVSKGKRAIIHAIIGFIVIKISAFLVKNTYEPNCGGGNIIQQGGIEICENIDENAKMIIIIINWLNTFIGILVVIMTIYAGFLYLTSNGEEEKQSKAKKIIIYILIGLLIIFVNYIIVTFFINTEASQFLNKPSTSGTP